jgi:hypothetical protein
MALEIGPVVGGIGIEPIRRVSPRDDTAANDTALPLPGQQAAPPAPPLTGVGARPLSGEALQTLQGTEEPKEQAGEDGELADEEKAQVEALKQRDQEVRRHEAAHAAAGGQYAGAPTFSYTKGPDGKQYAVGGEVSIDVSPGSTPEETIRKADQVRAAALAPADPSGQDRAVAAAATQMKLQAQAEAAKQRQDEQQGKGEEQGPQGLGAPEPPQLPEIVGPKPVGSETDEQGEGNRRSAVAAQAYGRAGGLGGSQRGSEGLSLVA